MNRTFHYFVEGECEKKFIDIYKRFPFSYFQQGKVDVFNFINRYITRERITMVEPNSNIILVYDTDVQDITKLEENVNKLKSYGFNNIYHIQSLSTFEDELIYSTTVKTIKDITGSASKKDFKPDFLKLKPNSLISKLKKCNFDNNRIWSRETK